MSRTVSTIYFYIPNQVTILDLSGVVQVFEEAKLLGLSYQLEFISNQTSVCSSSGLNLCSLKNYSDTSPTQNDILFFAGANTYQKAQFSENRHFFEWLRKANSCKTTICSICNGAFLLAKSGPVPHIGNTLAN
jgi:transcriptional regulator GlxA family with amidase domain